MALVVLDDLTPYRSFNSTSYRPRDAWMTYVVLDNWIAYRPRDSWMTYMTIDNWTPWWSLNSWQLNTVSTARDCRMTCVAPGNLIAYRPCVIAEWPMIGKIGKSAFSNLKNDGWRYNNPRQFPGVLMNISVFFDNVTSDVCDTLANKRLIDDYIHWLSD